MKGVIAALIFFTRLPFLQHINIPIRYFKNVVNFWTYIGLVTGGLMSLVFWLSLNIFPVQIAAIIAIIFRLLITGALHEDGLADFFDGFGGGTSKDRILTIMKDSHVGSYGVITLILYFLLLYQSLTILPAKIAPLVILSADVWSKFIASGIVIFLPYAKDASESKNKFIYNKPNKLVILASFVFAISVVILSLPYTYYLAVFAPILVIIILMNIMKNKIGGYTGDCCGATFLLCELSFYIASIICSVLPLLKKLAILSCLCIIMASCFGSHNSNSNTNFNSMLNKEYIKYAKGFDIEYYKDFTKVNIKDPWDTLKTLQTYILIDKLSKTPQNLPKGVVVKIPIDSIVVYSSVHASIIETLKCSDKIIGICESQYIESPLLLKALKENKITDLGESTAPNVEKMINIGTKLIVASPFKNASYGAVEKLSIPILEGADYMESNPLGRTEWLKLYSLFLGKKEMGDSLFNVAEQRYNQLKDLIINNTSNLEHKKVLSEKLYGAQWYVPCADSYLSTMYRDAGADYVFSDISGSGSAPLSFETVLSKAIDADVWLIKYNSKNDMTYADLKMEYQPYTNFKAWKQKKIYACNTNNKPYYLETTISPQYLLQDFIAIFNPQLMPSYNLRYFVPLK